MSARLPYLEREAAPPEIQRVYEGFEKSSGRVLNCVTHNSALGRRAGVPEAQLAALAQFETSPLFSDLERVVLRYAEQMTEQAQVDAALVTALQHALPLEALVQLTLGIAAANFTNRFNEALGTELEP